MSCKLEIINLQKFHRVNKNKIKELVKGVLKAEAADAEINVVLVDNKKIKEMNNAFLGHNYATDVLSFAYEKEEMQKNNVAGEIIISVEMAARLAQRQERAVDGELALYLTHGMLHLLGYNDKKKADAKKMHQRERVLLTNLGYNVPVPE
ncbi:MAG TPA: rRNA maturation RNase YbeY [Candidatus Brocadiaceae bacterium]|nr:rRNA maturation RNase YbeY [Candidatus Brocadiaceae bacterium]